MDVDSLVAIDVHTHVQASLTGRGFPAGSPEAAVADVFGSDMLLNVPELAAFYRERRMAAVCFMVDTVDWGGPVTNEEILELAAKEADALIPFVSIDPRRGAEGVAAARRLIADHNVRGFKFHPSLQGFFPDDRLAYPLYEVIAEHRLPAVFHTGQTGPGRGLRGGGGVRLKYSNPLLPRRGRRRLPGHQGGHGPPVRALAGRGAVGRRAQGERLDRPVGLVAEVLPAAARALGQHAAQGEDAVRHRLSRRSRPSAG